MGSCSGTRLTKLSMTSHGLARATSGSPHSPSVDELFRRRADTGNIGIAPWRPKALFDSLLDLIETAHARAVPIISALGTGNKRDAQLLRLADISQTEGCPLARGLILGI